MTESEIYRLLESLQREEPQTTLTETHISWVFLQPEFAYKVKKSLAFSFLDFSSAQKRLAALQAELRLNRRLASEVYLEVVGIVPVSGGFKWCKIDDCSQSPIDHALKMKRLDNSREMHVLLEAGKVTPADVQKIARKVARFHQQADVLKDKVHLPREGDLFRDIRSVAGKLEDLHIPNARPIIENAIIHSDDVWNSLGSLIVRRHELGMTVDGHGDLHSRNIFLLEDPVIFDCIEFDSQLRILDVLSDLAFLASDFVVFGFPEYIDVLLDAYSGIHPVISSQKERDLFAYYLWYRLNVRLKVTALKMNPSDSVSESDRQLLMVLWQTFTDWQRQCVPSGGTL
jgi:aminoglycoside phosphotransferase family enzyme